MSDIIETAKNLTPFLPFVKPVIDTLLKPKLDSLGKWLKEKKIDNQVIDFHIYETHFQEYLCRTLENSSIINTLIFPNQQIDLESIYQPLTLIDNSLNQQEKIKITCFPNALFEKYQRVLISDSAGMGKSTLSRFIVTQAIKENKNIPIFIELRKINSRNSILNEILNQLNEIDKIFDKDFLLRLLKLGEFLIVLDGFDEISNEEQELVTKGIKEFISKCSNNYFLLTSRPEGSLSAFGDFKVTYINGLRTPEAYELFQRFDKICCSNLSKKLIDEIKGINSQVNEFLTNPFLVSLLYKTYSFKKDIPSRKSTFYDEVYTALFQAHDLSKESYKRDKNSKLDIQDFRLVLREFAIYSAKKGEVEYSRTNAIEYISICKAKLPFLSFKENDFVTDLLTTVPIFTTEGNNIKWAHKSLQDYFAAEYITYHPQKEKIINYLIDKDVRKYQNIIDLVIELDPNLIRLYVLPKLLNDLVTHYDNCPKIDNIPENELKVRNVITYGVDFWINRVLITYDQETHLNRDEFDRVREYIALKSGKSNISMTNYEGEYMVAYIPTNKAIFIQMLGTKGLLGKSILKQKREKFSLFKELPQQPFRIEVENEAAKCNNPKYFAAYTDLMTSTFRLRMSHNRIAFVPDIDFCRSLLITIENEIINNNNDSFLHEF